jgi:hypothetical protein
VGNLSLPTSRPKVVFEIVFISTSVRSRLKIAILLRSAPPGIFPDTILTGPNPGSNQPGSGRPYDSLVKLIFVRDIVGKITEYRDNDESKVLPKPGLNAKTKNSGKRIISKSFHICDTIKRDILRKLYDHTIPEVLSIQLKAKTHYFILINSGLFCLSAGFGIKYLTPVATIRKDPRKFG